MEILYGKKYAKAIKKSFILLKMQVLCDIIKFVKLFFVAKYNCIKVIYEQNCVQG